MLEVSLFHALSRRFQIFKLCYLCSIEMMEVTAGARTAKEHESHFQKVLKTVFLVLVWVCLVSQLYYCLFRVFFLSLAGDKVDIHI